MISQFRGHYSFLSNFHLAWQRVGQLWYPSNEHFFQAHKTLIWVEHLEIAQAPTPAIAKRMGGPRGCKMPDGRLFKITIREDWKEIRVGFMSIGIDAKFGQNPPLHKALLLTHPHELCEGNYWHDNVWGDCLCARCSQSPGLNLLGRLLMVYRSKEVNYVVKKIL